LCVKSQAPCPSSASLLQEKWAQILLIFLVYEFYKKYFHWSVDVTYITQSVLNHIVAWLKLGKVAYACASLSGNFPTSNTHTRARRLLVGSWRAQPVVPARTFQNDKVWISVLESASCTVELSLIVRLEVAYSIQVWRNSVYAEAVS
jgi:hypothetical protein